MSIQKYSNLFQILKVEEDMQPLFDLFFVSSNNHKFKEAKIILDSFKIKIGFLKYALGRSSIKFHGGNCI